MYPQNALGGVRTHDGGVKIQCTDHWAVPGDNDAGQLVVLGMLLHVPPDQSSSKNVPKARSLSPYVGMLGKAVGLG